MNPFIAGILILNTIRFQSVCNYSKSVFLEVSVDSVSFLKGLYFIAVLEFS